VYTIERAPSSATSSALRRSRTSHDHRLAVRVSFVADVSELGHFLSFLPIFFGLTAQVIPLRSGLRVFCFGSALNNTVFPPTKQTLACDATQSELESPTGLKYAGLDEKSLCNYRTSRCPCGLQCC
jgi:hypothetical protein